jgi:fructose-bisphosphate aldolase class I
MNVRAKALASRVPWPLVFSFARAIQRPALEIWHGEALNITRAQQALYHLAYCNHTGLRGEYSADMEAA